MTETVCAAADAPFIIVVVIIVIIIIYPLTGTQYN